MKWGVGLMTALGMVWGNHSYARLTSDADQQKRQELVTISSWVAHLNYYYPQLGLAPVADLNSAGARGQLFSDLDALEHYLHGEQGLTPGSLTMIACGAVCGGGSEAKCHTCSVDDDN